MQSQSLGNLEGLRDIHIPVMAWWPPALGWWLLSLLLMMIGALVVFIIRYQRRKHASAMYLAQQELHQIKTDFKQHQDQALLIKALSILLRRISISVFNRTETAALTGPAWLRFLDQYTQNNEFSDGIGQVLLEAPYQAMPHYDSTALLDLISQWLDTVGNTHKRSII